MNGFYHRGSWRTRNTMLERFYRHSRSKDAENALLLLTSARHDPEKLGSVSSEHLPRLLKEDLVSMLHTVLEKGQMEVATKVLYHIRGEDWYCPERKFYNYLVHSLAKWSNFPTLERILDEMDDRRCKLSHRGSIELMESCVAAGQHPLAFRIFAALKADARVSRDEIYWKLIHSLNRAGEFDVSLKLEEELRDSADVARRQRKEKDIHHLQPWAS